MKTSNINILFSLLVSVLAGNIGLAQSPSAHIHVGHMSQNFSKLNNQ